VNRIKFHFTIQHLWGLIVLVGIFVFVNTHPIRPYDFWWHITIGKEILATGKIPAVDVYSFTEAGQPYPSYQMFWLMEVILYGVFRVGGPALVVFFQSLLVTSAYFILFWICKRVSNNWRIAAIGALFAAALGLNDWNVRPQGITFLLASLILLAIYEYRRKPTWQWLIIIPVSMLLWVNSHGTFIIGLVLIGIWWGQEIITAIRQRIKEKNSSSLQPVIVPGIVFGISILTCLVNPRGFGIINYLQTLTSNSIVQNLVTEWARPTFSSLMGSLFLIGLISGGILFVVSPKRPSFFQISTYLIFGILGLRTLRGSVWFGLVMAPIVAEQLTQISLRYWKVKENQVNQEGSRALNLILALLVGVMAIISLPWFKAYLPLPAMKAGLLSAETPIQATQALLEQAPPGELFNSMSFGSYLIWAAYPKYQVFADSRIELFPDKVWLDYFKISNADGDWDGLLRDYGINTLMLSWQDQPALIDAASHSEGWELIYQDQVASIFTRNK
jgi:hypothetical protein